MIFFDKALIYAWILTVQTFHITKWGKFNKVSIANFILCQKYLVKALVFFFLGKRFTMSVNCYIKLTTYYRLYFRVSLLVQVFIGMGNKLKNAKHISMVGNS